MIRTDNRQLFRAAWPIFWVAFGVRVAVILVGHTYRIRVPMDHFGFGWEMGRIARSLVLGQGYANPFNGPSGPTAWTPPLYPLLMALSFQLFGIYSNGAALFLLVVNSVFSAGIVVPVYAIAARCFDAQGIARRSGRFFGRETATPVALWSAWLWALYPAAMQYAVHWIWEMSLSAFLFTWTLALALKLRGVGDGEPAPGAKAQIPIGAMRPEAEASGSLEAPAVGLWVWFGALWGLVALSNASLLLCLPGTLVWIAWPWIRVQAPGARVQKALGSRLQTSDGQSGFWGVLGGSVLACVVFALVLTPWVLRNERALHAFVPTRANFGVELYQSSLESNDGLPWGTAMPLWPGDPEFRRYVRMGEVAYAKARGAEAMARLRARPALFARWTLDRVLFFWDGTPHPPDRHPGMEYLRQLSYSLISLCGLLGLGLMLRRRVEGAGLFALAFALVPLVYYVVTVQPRFRHPLEPPIAVLTVFLFRSTSARRSPVLR